MLAIVPLLAWIVTAVAVRRLTANTPHLDDLIRALLLTSMLWGVYLVVVTEGLSLFGALALGPLAACWVLPIPILLFVLHRRRTPAKKIELPLLDGVQIGLLAAVAAIVAVTGVVALVAAPNTWDSMSYHLPRVMHWAQNGSVAHYATHEPRQLYLTPWAEMVATHFQILSGGDRLAGLIQWCGMIGSLLATGLIAGRLGAGLDGRLLSLLVAATIPMGLLQTVSTQTDYVAAFHILSVVYFSGRVGEDKWALFGAAGSTGLAVLTKATAYLYLAPFLAVFAWRLLARRRWRAVRPLVLFGVVVLGVNLGHYSRNARLFDSPLAPQGLGEYHRYANETFGAGTTVSNVLRNAALHVAVAAPGVTDRAYGAVRGLHRLLGIDPDDPDTTWPSQRFEPPPARIHEDFSGNFWHAILVLGCLVGVAGRRLRSAVGPHLALVAVGFLLFAFYLKWSPWHSRLHLPFFLLAAPGAGVLLARLGRLPVLIAAALLVVQAIPFMAQNPLHPWQGERSIWSASRDAQTFYGKPLLGETYREAARQIAASECVRIGLDMPPDAWEYPLWVALRRAAASRLRLQSLTTGNVSERLRDAAFEPCAVVCLRCPADRRDRYAERFGEPKLAVSADIPYREENLLFLE